MKLLKFIFTISVLIFIFIACEEDPSSLGVNLIDTKITIGEYDSINDSLQMQYSFNVSKDTIKNENLSTILLGNYNGFKSVALLRFFTDLPDSVLNGIKGDSAIIISSKLKIKPIYKIGDISANFDFKIYEIKNSWKSINFTADSLANIQYDQVDMIESRSFTDSLIVLDINKDLILKWISDIIDPVGNLEFRNFGVIFEPTASSNGLISFGSYQERRASTGIPKVELIVKFTKTNKLDTLNLIHPTMNTFVTSGEFVSPGYDRLIVQGGYPVESKLKINFESLPKNIAINKAVMELTIDEVNSFHGSPSTDSIYVSLFSNEEMTKLSLGSGTVAILKRNGNIFSGEITWLLQTIKTKNENFGMRLNIDKAYGVFDRWVLYSNKESNKNLRPRIKITYTKKSANL